MLLGRVAYHWYELGNVLEVSETSLGSLKKSNVSNLSKLADVIETWLKSHTMSTRWEQLIAKVDGPFENRLLAYKLRWFLENIVHHGL